MRAVGCPSGAEVFSNLDPGPVAGIRHAYLHPWVQVAKQRCLLGSGSSAKLGVGEPMGSTRPITAVRTPSGMQWSVSAERSKGELHPPDNSAPVQPMGYRRA